MRSEMQNGVTETMQGSLEQFPDLETLTVGLTSVLRNNGSAVGQVSVLDRAHNLLASSFLSEIVTCRLDDGSALRLFCKYEGSYIRNGRGHRGGVAYEAAVHRHVLLPLLVSTPKYFGAYADMKAGISWLILEYLDRRVSVSESPQPTAIVQAARWIGRFHAANEARLSKAFISVSNRYYAEYYLGWARRTAMFAGPFHHRIPWLTTLCERFGELATCLLTPAPTIIHGEYYPKNILFSGGVIYPVDWESAVIAIGEIDLANHIEGWPPEIRRTCELEYQQSRWPKGPPADFTRTLEAARVYLHFRWLGNGPEWTTHESDQWGFEPLRSAAERLGLTYEVSL